jgi:mannose-6-phosphate isomerase-like protein (cupin superfamily)
MWKSISSAVFAGVVSAAAIGQAAAPVYRDDIEKRTDKNTDFRNVLFTGKNIQIVAMALRPGEEIGEEVHKVDQCFFVTEGMAQAVIDGNASRIGEHSVLCVPAGTRHNIRNDGTDALKLFTTYAPPQHPPGTVHHTKADAQKAEAAEHQPK